MSKYIYTVEKYIEVAQAVFTSYTIKKIKEHSKKCLRMYIRELDQKRNLKKHGKPKRMRKAR